MINVQAGRVLVVGLMAVLAGLDALSLPVLYAAALFLGIAETLFDTSAQSLMPSVVAKEQLSKANGRLYAAAVRGALTVGKASVPLVLDEQALAEVAYTGGDGTIFGALPAAVAGARAGDFAALLRLARLKRLETIAILASGQFNIGAYAATSCHHYAFVYDVKDPIPVRRAKFAATRAALPAADFWPFSVQGWTGAGFDGTDECLEWPADRTAGRLSRLAESLWPHRFSCCPVTSTPTHRPSPVARPRGSSPTPRTWRSRTPRTPRRANRSAAPTSRFRSLRGCRRTPGRAPERAARLKCSRRQRARPLNSRRSRAR